HPVRRRGQLRPRQRRPARHLAAAQRQQPHRRVPCGLLLLGQRLLPGRGTNADGHRHPEVLIRRNGRRPGWAAAFGRYQTERSLMRSILVLLHRYLGLATAVFLALAGITGSILAFHHELDEWLNPQFYQTDRAATAVMDGPSLIEHLEAA